VTYSAKLIALNRLLLLIPAPEPAFVDKLRELLLHQFLNLGNSLLQAFLGRAGDMEIQRRVLPTTVSVQLGCP
jgi:hypothetical protein